MPVEPIDIERVVRVDRAHMPRHVAIIMDGNGRWAARKGLPRMHGHEAGGRVVRNVVKTCSNLGLDCLTLYSFSLENWRRPREEVDFLMSLYALHLVDERQAMMDNNVRLRHVGRRDPLPETVLRELDASVEATRNNTGMVLALALNYGSRAELVDAVRRIASRAATGGLDPAQIDESTIDSALYTGGLPDPDLVIRTAGQLRLSNFLLWQISYAEFYVTDAHWPDFDDEELFKALRAYADRERRFGKIGPEEPDPPLDRDT